MKKKKIYLVFSPHPDDLDFSCAGTAAKLTADGNEVVYCIITDGSKGTQSVRQPKKELIAIRQREQKAAAATVGVKRVIFLGQTDGELEHTPALRKKIVAAIRRVKPNVILSFDPANRGFDNFYRYHRDHRVAAEAVYDAVYPAAGSPVFFPELSKRGLKAHQIDEVWFYIPERPNLYIDIAKTIDRKIAALLCHKSQMGDAAGLEKRIRQWAREQGKLKKMRYAETFRRVALN